MPGRWPDGGSGPETEDDMICGLCEIDSAEVGAHLQGRCQEAEVVFRLADGTTLRIPAAMLCEYYDG